MGPLVRGGSGSGGTPARGAAERLVDSIAGSRRADCSLAAGVAAQARDGSTSEVACRLSSMLFSSVDPKTKLKKGNTELYDRLIRLYCLETKVSKNRETKPKYMLKLIAQSYLIDKWIHLIKGLDFLNLLRPFSPIAYNCVFLKSSIADLKGKEKEFDDALTTYSGSDDPYGCLIFIPFCNQSEYTIYLAYQKSTTHSVPN